MVIFLIIMTALARIAPTASTTTFLVTQAKLSDQSAVAVWIFFANISKQSPALTNHHQQAATRVLIMFMNFEMSGQVIDAPGQDRDLYFWRTCVCFVNTGIFDDSCFSFVCQCHACYSPPKCEDGKRKSHHLIIALAREWRNHLHIIMDVVDEMLVASHP